jgi:diguanylate cyclase (GGDEF)-like protein
MPRPAAPSVDLLPAPSPDIAPELSAGSPEGWAELQDEAAAAAGLALLLVEGHQPPALAISNNNSICHAFQSSSQYAKLCDPFCGVAHRRAKSAGSRVDYKCHAGLQCFSMPVQIGERKDLAVIGGRAFVSGADYRALVDRFRAGELNELLDRSPFETVIFAEPDRLEKLANQIQKLAGEIDSDRSIKSTPLTQTRTEVPKQATDLQGEIDRLQRELAHRTHLDESLQNFLERISSADPHKTFESILKNSRELLHAERASLWVFDEGANELVLRAAAGLPSEVELNTRANLWEGVLGRVWESGVALVVGDLEKSGIVPASGARNYRTKSFISYPLTIGSRKIGLLNLTDKSNGANFEALDLTLLDIVGPQIAVALERAEWQERATQFQLMSITDPLTGLLNRRYLEERLTEELNRSKRYNYSMSCLMIDIDDFKSYNDRNGHPAGDVALKITAHSLKAALRSADIACRYGGEEFCILLPQTSVTEAGVIAERMRQKVAETEYPFGKSQPMGTVSISIGISTFGRNIDTAESVITAADRALYNAKRGGKNRLEFYVDNLTSTPDHK